MFGTNVDAFVALIAMALAPHAHDAGTKTKAAVTPTPSVQERVIAIEPTLKAANVIVAFPRLETTGR